MSWQAFESAVRSVFSQSSDRDGKTKRRPTFRPSLDALEDRLVPTTYSTNFPLTESPISEGGRWINGGTNGIDWGNVNTTPGYAVGVSPPNAGFNDATALLTGTWGPDQTAQATVRVGGSVFDHPEVELRLRSSISPHVNNGYEITESVAGAGNDYLIIVRWNGPLNDFTYLTVTNPGNYSGPYSVTTGDVVKATIVGNVISAYKNGVLIGQATDNTYTAGNPGFGFNLGVNGDYGYTNYSASDSPTTIPAAPTGLTATAANAQVSLAWNASSGATSYNLYRSTGTATPALFKSGIMTTSYPDTGLTNGTQYNYQVTAVNSKGESGRSNEVSATPQASLASWSYVQTNAADVSAATNSVAFTSATRAGDLVVAEISFNNNVNFSSITDSQGNTWVQIGAEQNSTSFGIKSRLYYAKNIKGGPLTVTSQLSGAPAYHELYIHEYSGLDTANPLDAFSANTATGSSFTSNNLTTTTANDLLYGIEIDSASASAAAGWTTRSTLDGNVAADKSAATVGSYAFTGSSSGAYMAWIAAFKPASGSANQPPTVATAASASPNTVTGTTTALSVLGADDGGEANLIYTWAATTVPGGATPSFSANGTNAAKNSTVTFNKAGSYTFQVTIKDAAGLTVTSSVNVTVNQKVTSIAVSPSTLSVADGATQSFTATAKDQFGAALSAQPTFTWSIDSGGVGGINSSTGQYTAPASGTGSATVRATNGSVSGTARVTVTQTPPVESPYGGVAWSIPGTIQAENYDNGGEGVAYHDLDSTNNGGAYRTDGVDIQPTSDTGGGYNVGWIQAGEWLKYTVNVATAGSYDLSLRLADTSTGGALHVEVDGVNVSGTLSVPNTGGWQTWTTITKTGINLTAGQHIVKVSFDTNGSNGWVGNLNWFSFAPGAVKTAGWGYVQTNAVNTSSASTAVTLSSSTNSGDLVIVEVSWSSTASFTSISDNQGNTYVQIGPEQHSASFGISSRLYYAKNIKGGALTVTSLLSSTPAYHETYVHEYSGLDPNNPLDAFSVNVGTGTSFTSNNLTTTAANDLLYGMDVDSGTGHAAAGWTARSTLDSNVAADENAASVGTYAFTGSSSGAFISWIAAFRPANPEMLAGTPLTHSHAPSLTQKQLDRVVAEAIADWAATGLSAAQISILQHVHFVITDLPGAMLGDTVGNTIYIDSNAAGYGWSLGQHVAPSKVDLLTVVSHELGHELGLADVATESHPGDVMDDTLAPGLRRLP
jgi:hypothetical protein